MKCLQLNNVIHFFSINSLFIGLLWIILRWDGGISKFFVVVKIVFYLMREKMINCELLGVWFVFNKFTLYEADMHNEYRNEFSRESF